ALESRHLGLITAQEIHSLQDKMDLLAQIADETIELDEIINIASKTEALQYEELHVEKQASVRIAVAKDKAFCFYYQDNLDLLEELGAKLI
ncbi:MAG: cobyrinic acid a,c-diamide synthase, partial [Clostridiales bacterium]|nr:cobyrinic acid a,c-diamide synthase [Clostridiales bacterium]